MTGWEFFDAHFVPLELTIVLAIVLTFTIAVNEKTK